MGVSVQFDRVIDARYSIRKILSGTLTLPFIAIGCDLSMLVIAIMAVILSNRSQYIDFREVCEELDPVEFAYITMKSRERLALAAIFHLASIGAIKFRAYGKRLYIVKQHRNIVIRKPWLKSALAVLSDGAPLDYELISRVSGAILAYEDAIYRELKERGYIKMKRSERFEPEFSIIMLFVGILSITALLLQLYGVYMAYSIIGVSSLLFAVPSTLILRAKSNLTPKGNGAIKCMRRHMREIARNLRRNLKRDQKLVKSLLESIFITYIGYFIVFGRAYIPVINRILKKKKLIPSWAPSYVHTYVPQTHETILTDFLLALKNTITSIIPLFGTAVFAGTTGFSFGGGGFGGGFGGGGAAGFG